MCATAQAAGTNGVGTTNARGHSRTGAQATDLSFQELPSRIEIARVYQDFRWPGDREASAVRSDRRRSVGAPVCTFDPAGAQQTAKRFGLHLVADHRQRHRTHRRIVFVGRHSRGLEQRNRAYSVLMLRVVMVAASVMCAAMFWSTQGTNVAGAAMPVPSFAGCFPKAPQTQPRSIVVACGDGNFFITAIHWTSWTAFGAIGTGVGHQNDCTPDCARGHFHLYTVSLRLYRPVRCRNGRLEFTRLTWTFVGSKPTNTSRIGTVKSPFYTGSRCP